MFPISSGTFTKLPQLLQYDGWWPSQLLCQFPQDSQIYQIRPHGLVHLQVP